MCAAVPMRCGNDLIVRTRRPLTRMVTALALAALAAVCGAQSNDTAGGAAALRARHDQLRPQLVDNAFHRPLYLSSSENGDRIEGDAYAELDQPIAAFVPIFGSAARLCDVLFLHINVRSCEAASAGAIDALVLTIGPKRDVAAGMVHRMEYSLYIEVAGPDYLRVALGASAGPLATSDYRVVIEAIALDGGRSFVHCRYAYGHGTLARMAMQIYLATAGRSKVGFSVVDRTVDGRPVYVGGERGSLERNAMRYYLAMIAYMGALPGHPQQQMEQRLRAWFQLTELYPLQLHELELQEYLDQKHRELHRRSVAQRPALRSFP